MGQIYTVIDFETTGLSAFHDRIVEIGATHVSGMEILDTFETLINPEMTIPDEVIQIHGITNEMIQDSPKIGDVLESFLNFLGDSIIVAHNAFFDMGFLYASLNQHNYPILYNTVLDTIQLAKAAFPNMANYRLSTLKSVLQIDIPGAHRALADSISTAHLLINCFQKLPPESIYSLYRGVEDAFVFRHKFLPVILHKIEQQEALIIKYRDKTETCTLRSIIPQKIIQQQLGWYLVAFCQLRNAKRVFRIDRIMEVDGE